MSANHSLILFEGDVTGRLADLFGCFGLNTTGVVERATGLAAIWEMTNWPRKGRSRHLIHKAILYNGTWTAVLDREMTMIFDTENCEHCSETLGRDIFGYLVENISYSMALRYYKPKLVRSLVMQNADITEEIGEPIPQEEGITLQEMFADGAMRVSRRLGFSDSLFAHPTSNVLIVEMDDPNRSAVDIERTAVRHKGKTEEIAPPQDRIEKPWWRLW